MRTLFLVGKPEGKRTLVDRGVDGRIILEWILGKWCRKLWTGFIWIRMETVNTVMNLRVP